MTVKGSNRLTLVKPLSGPPIKQHGPLTLVGFKVGQLKRDPFHEANTSQDVVAGSVRLR